MSIFFVPVGLLVLAHLAGALAFVPMLYATCERRGREEWRKVAVAKAPAGPTMLFREPSLVAVFHRQAPRAIRLTALGCFLLAMVALVGFLGCVFSVVSSPDVVALQAGVLWSERTAAVNDSLPAMTALAAMPSLAFGIWLFLTGFELLFHTAGVAERAQSVAAVMKWVGLTLLPVVATARLVSDTLLLRHVLLCGYALLLVAGGLTLDAVTRRARRLL